MAALPIGSSVVGTVVADSGNGKGRNKQRQPTGPGSDFDPEKDIQVRAVLDELETKSKDERRNIFDDFDTKQVKAIKKGLKPKTLVQGPFLGEDTPEGASVKSTESHDREVSTYTYAASGKFLSVYTGYLTWQGDTGDDTVSNVDGYGEAKPKSSLVHFEGHSTEKTINQGDQAHGNFVGEFAWGVGEYAEFGEYSPSVEIDGYPDGSSSSTADPGNAD
ncbi:hypothetical protein [Haloferax larsenii]|uniref:Uncharacterized protein n=1 Tax=Haloferax larsenii TaxID=302484 RepID=A0A1H7UFA3_HALLR|nr:hypothetical protein [Haloferax larsenii]SEL95720.1 hypothetical protein SAMN04488691_11273 [Haloferax larsenii]